MSAHKPAAKVAVLIAAVLILVLIGFGIVRALSGGDDDGKDHGTQASVTAASASSSSQSASRTSSSSASKTSSAEPTVTETAYAEPTDFQATEPTLLYCDQGALTILGTFSDGTRRPTPECDTANHRRAVRAETVCGSLNGRLMYPDEWVELCNGGRPMESGDLNGYPDDDDSYNSDDSYDADASDGYDSAYESNSGYGETSAASTESAY
ncbi:hypothetical protein ACL1CX_08870 [Corynebacterium striatum]|nr:hypothetical protein [Corynebacterium striatum]